MGSKRRTKGNAIFKTKTKKNKKRSKRKKKHNDKTESTEKTVNDLCATLEQIGIETGSSTATEKFLEKNGLEGSQIKRKKKTKSKRNFRKTFSMLKLVSSLPKDSEATPSESSVDVENLPFKVVSNQEFLFQQQDSKKFYKKIIRKERSKARKSKRFLH